MYIQKIIKGFDKMSSENYQYMKPYGDEGIKIIEEMNEHHKDIT